jgi:hypothetical protein
MKNMPNNMQIEIFELIANCVFKKMLKPSEFFDSKTPVFDHECTSAYEWTADLLTKIGLLEPVDKVPPGIFPNCYIFTCQPTEFRAVIERNVDAIPDEDDCLLFLWGYGGQSGQFYDEPIISFLEKYGFVETSHEPIGLVIERLKKAFAKNMPDALIPEATFIELASSQTVDHKLTAKGQRISDMEHAIAQGPHYIRPE